MGLALSLFAYAVIAFSGHVRLLHYWTELTSPPLEYLSRNQHLLLHPAPKSLSVVARNQDDFNETFQTRIQSGQAVLMIEKGRIVGHKWLNDELLLKLDSDQLGREIYQLYTWIVKFELASGVALTDIERALNVEIKLTDSPEKISSQAILDDLARWGTALITGVSSPYAVFTSDDGRVFEVVFPDRFKTISWFVVSLLFVCFVAALGISIFLMLQSLDRKLRSIEAVASRIARGELDARVKVAGTDDAVSRLGSAFNSMADHIQRLMYVQKEMIHAVSHELRTPVARIRFGVQMIEDCPSEEALKKQVKGIDGDIQELDELIDEILTYARLEQGGPILAFQETDISSIVEQVISEQSSVKPDMKIFAEYKEGADIWKMSEVETRYIHRSIQNLVGNATRYAKSTVKVVCSFDKDTCRVDVEDDGPGIPEDQWESVFTPFARLDDSRTRSSGGYGLGLSIVRRILFWHGGQAFLGRSPLGGAKFSLVWPRKQPKEG